MVKDTESQLAYLVSVKKSRVEAVKAAPEKTIVRNLLFHPLIHLTEWQKISEKKTVKCRKIENLNDALENMKTAIIQLEKFIS